MGGIVHARINRLTELQYCVENASTGVGEKSRRKLLLNGCVRCDFRV